MEGDDARERDIVQGASAGASESIRNVLSVLQKGPSAKSSAGTVSWSDEQRDLMAVGFKDMFEVKLVERRKIFVFSDKESMRSIWSY